MRTVKEISPWSALKLGAVLSVCLWVAWMVAAALIYILLGVGGIWDKMNDLMADLIGADAVSTGMFFGVAAGLGVLEVVVVALMSPVLAVLYNASAGIVGGLKVRVEGEGADGSEDTAVAPAAVQETVQDASPSAAAAAGFGKQSDGTESTGEEPKK
ncbi:MAG TPA: DUF3566 domain-containing protein [Candidatus Corynebacterium avicola]|uniref:DUF3566 domain-containing protein n=1 Tax=Candidatus Corynebacterium avicola TaxID=2838527 RepID=A0A9D1UNF6_9CORY|nr:DUF3566 domain-containing protein [Candidatus Corynebacterium avicola]